MKAAWLDAVRGTPDLDAVRLDIASLADMVDPPRAEYIRVSIERCRLEVDAIVRYLGRPDDWDAANQRARDLLRAHAVRWSHEDDSPPGVWHRGFLEEIWFQPDTTVDTIVRAMSRFPILHLHVADPARFLVDPAFVARVPGLVSLFVTGVGRGDAQRLIGRFDLRRLRHLYLEGDVTEDDLRAICETDLPGLEDLQVRSELVADPCDEPFSIDDLQRWYTDAYASEVGFALEERYGWKKYLHAVARFSVYPPSLGAFDILPPHPPEPSVLRLQHRGGKPIGPWPIPRRPVR
jgi:hypothetical protein